MAEPSSSGCIYPVIIVEGYAPMTLMVAEATRVNKSWHLAAAAVVRARRPKSAAVAPAGSRGNGPRLDQMDQS
eukprot:COSAG06_NODE_2475_length_6797_cov_4.794267_7_plen_73_part_00